MSKGIDDFAALNSAAGRRRFHQDLTVTRWKSDMGAPAPRMKGRVELREKRRHNI
jgi:hypothetical protein